MPFFLPIYTIFTFYPHITPTNMSLISISIDSSLERRFQQALDSEHITIKHACEFSNAFIGLIEEKQMLLKIWQEKYKEYTDIYYMLEQWISTNTTDPARAFKADTKWIRNVASATCIHLGLYPVSTDKTKARFVELVVTIDFQVRKESKARKFAARVFSIGPAIGGEIEYSEKKANENNANELIRAHGHQFAKFIFSLCFKRLMPLLQ